MNISLYYDIESIIRELETILQISAVDFEEKDMDIILGDIKKRIYRQYSVDLSENKISSTEMELVDNRNALQNFVTNVSYIHSKLCGWCQVARYQASINVSLYKVNNFGCTELSLKQCFKLLQKKVTQVKAHEMIQSLKPKLAVVSVCKEKRLLMLLIISYELGFSELTAALAEVLYLAVLYGIR